MWEECGPHLPAPGSTADHLHFSESAGTLGPFPPIWAHPPCRSQKGLCQPLQLGLGFCSHWEPRGGGRKRHHGQALVQSLGRSLVASVCSASEKWDESSCLLRPVGRGKMRHATARLSDTFCFHYRTTAWAIEEGRPSLGPRGTPPESSRLSFRRVHGRRSVNTCGRTNRPTNSAGPSLLPLSPAQAPQAQHCPGSHPPLSQAATFLGVQVATGSMVKFGLSDGTRSASPAQEFPLPEPRPGAGLGRAGGGATQHTWAQEAGQVIASQPLASPSPARPQASQTWGGATGV